MDSFLVVLALVGLFFAFTVRLFVQSIFMHFIMYHVRFISLFVMQLYD